jgi:hypothetical protein
MHVVVVATVPILRVHTQLKLAVLLHCCIPSSSHAMHVVVVVTVPILQVHTQLKLAVLLHCCIPSSSHAMHVVVVVTVPILQVHTQLKLAACFLPDGTIFRVNVYGKYNMHVR